MGEQQNAATSLKLVSTEEVAALLEVSKATIYKWNSNGVLPSPIKGGRLGGGFMWSLEDLKRWVACGCPRREEWEVARMRQGA